jgi:hypothetical protein
MAEGGADPAEFIRSERGGHLLVRHGYLFRLDKKLVMATFYKCREERCNSRVKVEGGLITSTIGAHQHPPPSAALLQRKIFTEDIKEQARTSVLPISRVYRDQLATNVADGADPVLQPTFLSVKSAAYKARLAIVPPLPPTAHDYVIEAGVLNSVTVLDSRNVNPAGPRIVGFTTENLLRRLRECRQLQIDGTFSCCPELFYQLFILHGKIFNAWEPLVFGLLPTKEQRSYEQFWDLVHAVVRRVSGRDCEASDILTDYEVGSMNAVIGRWPRFPLPLLHGCFFHYTQCILRRASSGGLKAAYENDPEVNATVRRLMALPLMPLARIEDAFQYIIGDMPGQAHPNHAQIFELMDYMTTTWIDNGSQFQPRLWNHYGEDRDRTTNAAESRHHALNQIAGNHRLNIHSFVREVVKELRNSEARIEQRAAGNATGRQNSRAKRLTTTLARLRNEFETGQRTLEQFLNACGHQLQM